MHGDLASALIATLPATRPGLYNPWASSCQYDTDHNGPVQRQDRLVQHFNCDPALLLIGEAPGYQGCRYSGVAFTSERLLLAGSIPRCSSGLLPGQLSNRLTTREKPFSEPSATIVWKALDDMGIAPRTLLWNAVQLHPHKPGDPWSNRTPTPAELDYGIPALQMLLERFPSVPVLAVGKKADQLLKRAGITPAATLRHPANGGARLFREGLRGVINQRPLNGTGNPAR